MPGPLFPGAPQPGSVSESAAAPRTRPAPSLPAGRCVARGESKRSIRPRGSGMCWRLRIACQPGKGDLDWMPLTGRRIGCACRARRRPEPRPLHHLELEQVHPATRPHRHVQPLSSALASAPAPIRNGWLFRKHCGRSFVLTNLQAHDCKGVRGTFGVKRKPRSPTAIALHLACARPTALHAQARPDCHLFNLRGTRFPIVLSARQAAFPLTEATAATRLREGLPRGASG